MKDNPTKPKRRLTDIDFSTEGSHIALVHKEQGGAANGYVTLLTKATNPINDPIKEDDVTEVKSGLEPKTNIEDDSMGINKANTAIQTEETNMPNSENITKAQYEDIQKSLDELKKDNESKTQELQKAAELLKHYKDKEEAAIAKARKESLVAVVEVEEQAEKLFKAVASLDEQQFQDVVEVLKSVSTKEDDFFVEKGATAVTDTDQNYLRDILIQKHKQA